jgi:hypothetical protein
MGVDVPADLHLRIRVAVAKRGRQFRMKHALLEALDLWEKNQKIQPSGKSGNRQKS